MQREELIENALEWLKYAKADIAMAEIPLPANGMYEHLCFHAQQTAEKAIKAVLIANGINFPKTHNIEFLLTLLPDDISCATLPEKSYKLTGYATIFRYPGEEEPVSQDDYQELLVIARGILTWAKLTLACG
ncbi:MAG: HEPN domain-containing protein [bacterium]